MAIDKAIAKAILGNGKRAVKNGVKNGVNATVTVTELRTASSK